MTKRNLYVKEKTTKLGISVIPFSLSLLFVVVIESEICVAQTV